MEFYDRRIEKGKKKPANAGGIRDKINDTFI